MNKAQIAVIATGLLLAAGAFAQDAVKRTEQIQNSAEQMKPQMNPPERTMAAPSHAETAAERKAREMRESSEMMKPQTSAPAGSMDKAPMSSPPSAAEAKAAAERQKSEMMKPQ